MTQTAEVQPEAAPEVATPIPLCDREGCDSAEAVFTYTWDWGESGQCCARHQVELTQLQSQLKRTCQFAPLNANASPPVQREERVRLKAEALVLAEELEEAKGRGVDLYRQNQLLSAQVQALTVRGREADAQLKDAAGAATAWNGEMDKLRTELGNAVDEISRLKVLVPSADAEPPGTEPEAGRGKSKRK